MKITHSNLGHLLAFAISGQHNENKLEVLPCFANSSQPEVFATSCVILCILKLRHLMKEDMKNEKFVMKKIIRTMKNKFDEKDK